jgi:hypothetical protein
VTNLASGLFITIDTQWSSSFIFCCSVTVRDTQQTATGAQGSYCYVLQPAHCSHNKHLAPTYKQKEIEGNYIPPMPGLLTKKWKCKQMVWVTERREISMVELSLWLTYSTYNNAREKRNKTTTKKWMCVKYTTIQSFCLLVCNRLCYWQALWVV